MEIEAGLGNFGMQFPLDAREGDFLSTIPSVDEVI